MVEVSDEVRKLAEAIAGEVEDGATWGEIRDSVATALAASYQRGVEDVPKKNIALRRAHDEIARLRQALSDVKNPVEYCRRHAEANGTKLNGMAYSIANDLHFVQKLASDALDAEPRALSERTTNDTE